MKRIGLFGGSFDPIHQAHVDVALCAIEQLHLDEVNLFQHAIILGKIKVLLVPKKESR